MRTLELRLEEWNYGWDDGKLAAWEAMQTPPRTNSDYARVNAALEFFDRALVAALGGVTGAPGGTPARTAFVWAAALTLLRFGVRIVGLDGEQRRQEGEGAVKRLPRGDRGFLGYGQPLQCTYGTTIEVYESSSAEGPHVWLKLRQDPRVLRGEQAGEATAHLSEEQASAVVASLSAWLADIPARWGRTENA